MKNCIKCGQALEENEMICENCGSEQNVPPSKQKSKMSVIIIGIVVLVAVVGIGVFLATGDSRIYKSAQAKMENGEYQEAVEALEKIPEYKDAADLITECHYRSAQVKMDEGDYQTAIDIFKNMPDYEDVSELTLECYFEMAVLAYEKSNYEEALSYFDKASGFPDPERKFDNCKYDYALTLIEQDLKDEAITYLEGLNFKDSDELLGELNEKPIFKLVDGQFAIDRDLFVLQINLLLTAFGKSSFKPLTETDGNYTSLLFTEDLNIGGLLVLTSGDKEGHYKMIDLYYDDSEDWDMEVFTQAFYALLCAIKTTDDLDAVTALATELAEVDDFGIKMVTQDDINYKLMYGSDDDSIFFSVWPKR